MEKSRFKGNNVGEYPVTTAEKVAVPSMRKRLVDLLDEITAVTEAAPVKIETGSITELTKDQLDALKVGDVVAKVTGNMKHLYLVSYKGEGEGEGICLSYNAAGYGETVSYDRTESGWQYNSTDVKTYGDSPSPTPTGGLRIIKFGTDLYDIPSDGVNCSTKTEVATLVGISESDVDALFDPDMTETIIIQFSITNTEWNDKEVITSLHHIKIEDGGPTAVWVNGEWLQWSLSHNPETYHIVGYGPYSGE